MEKYEVVRTLGAGAGGRVLLAKEINTGKYVAIKEITLDPKKKTKTKEVVEKEAKILSSMKHPHIVCMLESFFDKHEEQLFIVQDFCDGGSLHDRVTAAAKSDSLIEESQVMQWFVQVTMAVYHIHLNKILHRDLKTQNVFLTKKGVAKIGDFGIARTLENTVDMARTCCGTPSYLSPELCQDVPYSSKADVWSLGCLLHELCALKYAFDAENLISLYYKIVKSEPQEIPDKYSDSLRELVQQMLSKKPDDRPSAGAILNLPYVQEHLASFIKEKENLQETLHARKHLQVTKVASNVVKRCTSAVGSRLQQELGNKSLKQRSKSATPSKLVPVATNEEKTEEEKNENGTNDNDQVQDQDEGSDYSDDFVESEEEEYLDDFEDDSPMNGSLKKPLSITSPDTDEAEADYPDDFEEDSDEEEVLDNILASARAAQEVGEEEELVEDSETESVSCRQRLKEHFIGVLGGEKVFEDVCGQLENSSIIEKTLAERPEFEEVQSGSNLMETCYLVNELFIENTKTES